jgi:hypothetical protein
MTSAPNQRQFLFDFLLMRSATLTAACAALVLLCLCSAADAKKMKHNTNSKPMAGKLNVHIVPHTHDGTSDAPMVVSSMP